MVHGSISIAILIISAVSLYLVVRIYKVLVGPIMYPTISGFFFLKFLIFAFIGSVLLNVIHFEYEADLGFYQRKDLLLLMWAYSLAALWLQVFGVFLANTALGYKPGSSMKKLEVGPLYITKSDQSGQFKFVVLVAILIGLATLKLYLNQIEMIPIQGLFMELRASELAVMRSDAGSNFEGRYWLYRLFMREVPLLLFMIVFFMKETGLFWKMIYRFLFIYIAFVSVMSIEKAPIIQFFLLILLLNLYQQGRVNLRLLAKYSVLICVFLISMYMFFMGMANRDVVDIVSAILHRIFIGQIHPFWWWQLYQEQFGYLYGLSMPNPAHIFPFEHIRITVEVMKFAHPELLSLGVVGSMPTVYFAEWFINFGPIIALLSMILIGFFAQVLDAIILRRLSTKKTVLLSAIYLYLVEYFARFSGTGYSGIIIDQQWIIPALIVLALYFVKNSCLRNTEQVANSIPR